MPRELEILLEAARKAAPSSEHRDEQRKSFVYGNTAFENELTTREMVEQQAAIVARERNDERR